MKRSIPTRLLVVAFVVLVLSCTDDSIKNTAPEVQAALPEFVAPEGISFNGDYLEIPTPQLYDEIMKRLKASDPETVSRWSAKLGLTSMRSIYGQALKEQDDYMVKLEKEYRKLSESELKSKPRPVIPQSSFVAEHARLFEFDEYGRVIGLKLSNPLMDPLINKDGLIKVAGHIFQYNEDNTKMIMGGDASKIDLLTSVDVTDKKLGIFVNPVTVEHKTKTANNDQDRASHSHSDSFMIGDGGWYKYYLAWEVSLVSTTWAIYDYNNPVCDPPGCWVNPEGRTTKTQDCNCYYPVIGWDGHVTHYATQHNTKIGGGVETQHQSTKNTIQGSVDDNYFGRRYFNESNVDQVNLTVYIYDGTFYPGFSTTAASYRFYSDPDGDGPGQTLAGYDTYSWSD